MIKNDSPQALLAESRIASDRKVFYCHDSYRILGWVSRMHVINRHTVLANSYKYTFPCILQTVYAFVR